MKLAIIGSRSLTVKDLGRYVPKETSEIVSGGAKGIDADAAFFAKQNGLKLTEILPDYERYGRAAPLKRNDLIGEYADECLAFWDGKSKGTLYTIKRFEKLGKKITVIKKTEGYAPGS